MQTDGSEENILKKTYYTWHKINVSIMGICGYPLPLGRLHVGTDCTAFKDNGRPFCIDSPERPFGFKS